MGQNTCETRSSAHRTPKSELNTLKIILKQGSGCIMLWEFFVLLSVTAKLVGGELEAR